MAYCFQQRRTHLAWYVRDEDERLVAEGMLEERARVEYNEIGTLQTKKRQRPLPMTLDGMGAGVNLPQEERARSSRESEILHFPNSLQRLVGSE